MISINTFILGFYKDSRAHQNDQARGANETPYEVVFCAQPAPVIQIKNTLTNNYIDLMQSYKYVMHTNNPSSCILPNLILIFITTVL